MDNYVVSMANFINCVKVTAKAVVVLGLVLFWGSISIAPLIWMMTSIFVLCQSAIYGWDQVNQHVRLVSDVSGLLFFGLICFAYLSRYLYSPHIDDFDEVPKAD